MIRVQFVPLAEGVRLPRSRRPVEDEIRRTCREGSGGGLGRILLGFLNALVIGLPLLTDGAIVEVDLAAGVSLLELRAQALEPLDELLIAPVIDLGYGGDAERLQDRAAVVVGRHALDSIREREEAQHVPELALAVAGHTLDPGHEGIVVTENAAALSGRFLLQILEEADQVRQLAPAIVAVTLPGRPDAVEDLVRHEDPAVRKWLSR